MATIFVVYDDAGRITSITRQDRGITDGGFLTYTVLSLIRDPGQVSPIRILESPTGTIHELRQIIRDAPYLTDDQERAFLELAQGSEPFDKLKVTGFPDTPTVGPLIGILVSDAPPPASLKPVVIYYIDP